MTSINDMIEKAVSFDILVRNRRDGESNTIKYYVPKNEESVTKTVNLGFLNNLVGIATKSDDQYLIEGQNELWRGWASMLDGNVTKPNFEVDGYYFNNSLNYCLYVITSNYEGSDKQILECSRQENSNFIKPNNTITSVDYKINGYYKPNSTDNIIFRENNFSPDTTYYSTPTLRMDQLIDFGYDYSLITSDETNAKVTESGNDYTFTNSTTRLTLSKAGSLSYFIDQSLTDISNKKFDKLSISFASKTPLTNIKYIYSSMPEQVSRPMMFAMRRNIPVRTSDPYLADLPAGSIPQLRIKSSNDDTIGYIYIASNGTDVYHRHFFLDGTTYWDELIGTKNYYEFKSHPSNYLINHNYLGEESYNSALKLLLRTDTNTVICNTGIFNMYPMFFIKGGCKISDTLNTYYSFLTNTSMKDLFVTINSRTSTMLHNGYTIDASYNAIGMPLFKNVVNENQLVISSGRPELLKAIFCSEETITHEEVDTGLRKAKFLINSKPMYGRRNKFAVHIFNKDFADMMSNIFNEDTYNTDNYYNALESSHLLLDSPVIEYEQEEGGWVMYLTYRAYSKTDAQTIYYDFYRNGNGSLQYSNVGTVSSITDTNAYIYISFCDYQELEIRSEGEDYSVGCQARGVI